MLVKEIMNKKVDVINCEKNVSEAAKMMAAGGYGALPVEKADKMVGMITDRDITVRVVAKELDPKQVKVSDCMSPGIDYCYEEDDIVEVAKKMTKGQRRRIPVINSEKRLVGIVSSREIVTKAKNKDLTQSTFEQICH